jgi:hypothetical protein
MAGRDLILVEDIWIASLRLDNSGIEKVKGDGNGCVMDCEY